MPIVIIYLYEGRSLDQKRKLAAEVTEAICRALDVGPDVVRIMIYDMPQGRTWRLPGAEYRQGEIAPFRDGIHG